MLNLVGIRAYLRTMPWVHRLAIGAVVAVASGVLIALASRSPVQRWFDLGGAHEDAAELKQIGMAMKAYSGEFRDLWPAASAAPIIALPDLSTIAASLLKEPNGARLLDRIAGKTEPRLCYLGYLAVAEPEGLAVLDYWRKPEAAADRGKDISLDTAVPSTRGQLKTVMRLKEGIERFLITDICNPAGSAKAQAGVPVLWEMPTAKRPGGLVMYMDLHVEWMPYPGEFPMSPAFIERLQRLIKGEPELAKDPSASPVRGIADRVAGILNQVPSFAGATTGWWVDKCDDAPSVTAGDAHGYRMILKHTQWIARGTTLRYIPPS